MRNKGIAIAIGLALILGIILIGGIRISRASELAPSVRERQSRVLLNKVDTVRDLQRTLLSRDLGRVVLRESNRERGLLDRVEDNRLERVCTLRSDRTLRQLV